MSLIQRHGFYNAIIAYTGQALGFVNTAVLFTNFFTQEEFGLTRVLLHASMLYVQLASLGAPKTIIKFFPHFRNKVVGHSGFFPLIAIMLTIGITVTVALLFIFKPAIVGYYEDRSALFVSYFLFLIPLGLFRVYNDALEAYSKAIFQSVSMVFGREVLLRLFTSMAIGCFIFGWVDLFGFVVLFTSSYALVGIIQTLFLVVKGELPVFRSLKNLSFTRFREMLTFGGFNLLSGMTNTMTITIDSLMLGAMVGLDSVAGYGIVVYFASIMMVPSRAMYKVVPAMVSNWWAENKPEKIHALYKSFSITNLLIGAVIFLNIWINIDDIFRIMPEEYASVTFVFFLIGMGRLFDLLTGINAIILVNSDKYKMETLFNVLMAILTVGTNYIFINLWGIEGAAFATMITIIAINSLRTLYVYFAFRMNPFTWKTLVGILLFGIVLGIGTILPDTGWALLNIAYKSLIITSGFLLTAYSLKLSEQLNDLIDKQVLRKLGLRK